MCVDSNVLLGIAGQINPISPFGNPASTDNSTIATTHRSNLENEHYFLTGYAQVLMFWGEMRGLKVKDMLQAVLGSRSHLLQSTQLKVSTCKSATESRNYYWILKQVIPFLATFGKSFKF